MRQVFTIPGRLDGLNEYTESNRAGKYKGASSKRSNEEIVCWAIAAARLKPMRTPVRIHATWYEGKKPCAKTFRKRDKDNVRCGMKFIQDALVSMKIIDDDGWDKVTPTDDYRVDRDNPRIVVEIWEVDKL